MNKKLGVIFIVTCFLLNVSGCATVTGPWVSQREIKTATEELKVKALAFKIKQLQKLNNIGTRLMFAIPKEDLRKPPQPFLGVVVAKIDKHLQELYHISVKKGVVIVVISEKSPAQEVGLRSGDVLLTINNKKITRSSHFKRVASKFKIGDLIPIEILRGSEIHTLEAKIGQIPANAPIIVLDIPKFEACTDGKMIYVSYGFLNFTKSDDEIATVLAHELGHVVRGHVAKRGGGQILGLFIAVGLGALAEASAPGSGEGVIHSVGDVYQVFDAAYSRDCEREADYFGTKFVYYAGYDVDVCASLFERMAVEIPDSMIKHYLSTHPISPERMLRVKKTIEQLKAGKLETYQAERK